VISGLGPRTFSYWRNLTLTESSSTRVLATSATSSLANASSRVCASLQSARCEEQVQIYVRKLGLEILDIVSVHAPVGSEKGQIPCAAALRPESPF
jgi:hypothetical protein